MLAFAFAVSLIAGVAFGMLPAVGARALDVAASLAENGTAPVGGRLRVRTSRARAIIIAGQVAIACVLLVSGTLFVRSFTALLSAELKETSKRARRSVERAKTPRKPKEPNKSD